MSSIILATSQIQMDVRHNEHWRVLGESILTFNTKHEEPTDEESNAFFEQMAREMEGVGVDPWNTETIYLCITESGNTFELDAHDLMEFEVDKNGCDFVKFSDGHYGFVGYGNVGSSGWIKILWALRDVRYHGLGCEIESIKGTPLDTVAEQ